MTARQMATLSLSLSLAPQPRLGLSLLHKIRLNFLEAGRSGFYGSIPDGGWNFSLHHRFQNGSGAHPASYPTGTGVSFPGGKAAGA
jgi:hypothetical protein